MGTKVRRLLPLVGCAAILAFAPGAGVAAPIGLAAARAASENAMRWQPVQYHGSPRGRFIDQAARQRWIDQRWSRMKVQEDAEGFIYLPGINTDRRGITTLSGPPRTLQQPRRLGHRPTNMQRRFGEPPPGGWQRGRITGH
jgi:hypothetical protein